MINNYNNINIIILIVNNNNNNKLDLINWVKKNIHIHKHIHIHLRVIDIQLPTLKYLIPLDIFISIVLVSINNSTKENLKFGNVYMNNILECKWKKHKIRSNSHSNLR